MLRSSRLGIPAALAVFAVGVGLTACGSSNVSNAAYVSDSAVHHTATAASASAPALKLAKVAISDNGSTVHQTVLVNSAGHAVYLLSGDSKTHSKCSSQFCLGAWPAVTTKAGKPKVGPGIHGKLTVWTHKGMHQLVLSGHPLYTYSGDSRKGVATGQGIQSFGGTWSVLNGSGQAAHVTSVVSAPIETSTAPSYTTPTTPTTTTYGYGGY